MVSHLTYSDLIVAVRCLIDFYRTRRNECRQPNEASMEPLGADGSRLKQLEERLTTIIYRLETVEKILEILETDPGAAARLRSIWETVIPRYAIEPVTKGVIYQDLLDVLDRVKTLDLWYINKEAVDLVCEVIATVRKDPKLRARIRRRLQWWWLLRPLYRLRGLGSPVVL